MITANVFVLYVRSLGTVCLGLVLREVSALTTYQRGLEQRGSDPTSRLWEYALTHAVYVLWISPLSTCTCRRVGATMFSQWVLIQHSIHGDSLYGLHHYTGPSAKMLTVQLYSTLARHPLPLGTSDQGHGIGNWHEDSQQQLVGCICCCVTCAIRQTCVVPLANRL